MDLSASDAELSPFKSTHFSPEAIQLQAANSGQAQLLFARNARRVSAWFYNDVTNVDSVYIGGANVQSPYGANGPGADTGFRLLPGMGVVIRDTTDDLYGITTRGATTVLLFKNESTGAQPGGFAGAEFFGTPVPGASSTPASAVDVIDRMARLLGATNVTQLGGTNVSTDSEYGDAAISSAAFKARASLWLYRPDLNVFERERTPSKFATVGALAVVANTDTAVWTPAAGKKFRLLAMAFSYSGTCSVAFKDGAGGPVIWRIQNPAATVIPWPGKKNGYLSTTANNPLEVSATLGANLDATFWGNEE